MGLAQHDLLLNQLPTIPHTDRLSFYETIYIALTNIFILKHLVTAMNSEARAEHDRGS